MVNKQIVMDLIDLLTNKYESVPETLEPEIKKIMLELSKKVLIGKKESKSGKNVEFKVESSYSQYSDVSIVKLETILDNPKMYFTMDHNETLRPIEVVTLDSGSKYIRSDSDHSGDNNIDALPTFK